MGVLVAAESLGAEELAEAVVAREDFRSTGIAAAFDCAGGGENGGGRRGSVE